MSEEQYDGVLLNIAQRHNVYILGLVVAIVQLFVRFFFMLPLHLHSNRQIQARHHHFALTTCPIPAIQSIIDILNTFFGFLR